MRRHRWNTFFSTLKREWTGDRLYRTRQQAIAGVREYAAAYYNSKRLHSMLGYETLMDYEKTLNKVSGISCPLHCSTVAQMPMIRRKLRHRKKR
ncbi:MAG: IS3 family transposase [Gammaproteobacteria bacterium]